jgi:hypothetical protein
MSREDHHQDRQGHMARYRAIIIATVASAGLAATAARGGPNLTRNPGLEEGPSPLYPGVGLYWETNDALPHPDVDVLTASTRHAGAHSQWLKADPVWDLGMLRQLTAYNSITPGKTYRVSAWIKTANIQNPAGWYVFGVWFFNNDTYLADSKMPKPEILNYDWREIAWNVVPPPPTNRIGVVLTRHTDGDAWYDDISLTEILPGEPQISVLPGSFDHRILKGGNVPADILAVQNMGGGTLNYTITGGAAWLNLSPTAGTSTGEVDEIAVSYSSAGLSVGHYATAITVSDPGAVAAVVEVLVSMTIWTPGDLDYDGDVDQLDFGLFQACYSGNEVPQVLPICLDARMDSDEDVDSLDLAVFLKCLGGPGVPADPSCAD